MKEIITYEAFDGTEFDNEDECVEYERLKQITDVDGEIFFYGSNKQPIPLTSDSDSVWFAVVNTEKAAKWWQELCEFEGTPAPFDSRACTTGFFWYDDRENVWKFWQEEMEKLQILADEFQQFEK